MWAGRCRNETDTVCVGVGEPLPVHTRRKRPCNCGLEGQGLQTREAFRKPGLDVPS